METTELKDSELGQSWMCILFLALHAPVALGLCPLVVKEVDGHRTVRISGEVTLKMLIVFRKTGVFLIPILFLKRGGDKETESTEQSLSFTKQTGSLWSLSKKWHLSLSSGYGGKPPVSPFV